MIRIGDFSRLSRVTVKTLRYYDEVGLLKPIEVDRSSGYRYYEFSQLQRLYRILAFKDLGFSLEEIGHLLEENLPAEQMRGMLKLRQAEIRQQVEQEAERLDQVERWLRKIEQEDVMSDYDVVLKKIEATRVASLRRVVPTPPDQGVLWGELLDFVGPKEVTMTGQPMAIYHDPEFKERDWDIEVCLPIAEKLVPEWEIQVYEMPGFDTAACVVHNGPFATILDAYDALGKWVAENGYRTVAPVRELNLRLPDTPGDQNDPNTVNEIQFPVEKA